MEAKLNIYENCESEKPTKTYVCRRLLYGTAKKLEEISNKAKEANPEEQEQNTIDFLRTIFKDFQDNELNYIDTTEYFDFMKIISLESQRILSQAQKN